ncbi:radical SAM family heme chaperone HemW [Eubacterium sp. 1001713B170207_170306_E7]|uniref:radical SAM family heme chaperone HemW n=1 Tax=Eubacterium sp. 1001713B170207_170306_E7 TaxID=2787097 RepID=UPI0018999C7D|nr:radical SAM family heme chaperone HemW [Eubacterium sp. 1001713B170207_170306_E7]
MENVGIYVHVPFCVQKCQYCDFASWAGCGPEAVARYFDAVCLEIRAFGARQGRLSADTVYFGGGTPSSVAPRYIGQVMEAVGQCFVLSGEAVEATIEVNPGTLTSEKCRAYRDMGINRVSMGLQTTSDQGLKALGRIHTYADFEESLALLDRAGFENISADLMFGLPGQTLADVQADIACLTALAPIRHISCYSLKIEEGTAFDALYRQGRLALPDEALERQMQHAIIDGLAARGFEQYEISNFARKGWESRHNSRYWVMKPYVGFGLGAASYYRGERRTNVMDMQDYCALAEQGKPPVLEAHTLDLQEKKGDFMFLGLRRMYGVDDADYQKLFGSSFFEDFEEIGGLVEAGLLTREGPVIRLTRRGQDLANQVFMAFV